MAAKSNTRIVSPRPDGRWQEKAAGASRAGSVHDTQAGAAKAANRTLGNTGGGELLIQGRNGQFRSKDTIAPGRESRTRDTEH
jgi:hypothetical protein